MVWSEYAVLMSGKTYSIKLNNNPGCLPGSTFVYSEVFKLDFSSASTHLKSSLFSILHFGAGTVNPTSHAPLILSRCLRIARVCHTCPVHHPFGEEGVISCLCVLSLRCVFVKGAYGCILVSSMSDSEDSTVTYTEIPSPYEDPSDMGSPGVEGPIFQDPPSPDYVPGPEEPEQAPPSPIYVPFVPEPVYPEFLPVDDEVFPAEEQPMPAADSPTHQSPGYIPESDPEEDPEEDDDGDR
ncbi:hypothetical protein Tco_0222522 [Tanacetum coccineum]